MSQCLFSVADLEKDSGLSIPADLADGWRCPRVAVEGCDNCLLHRHPERTDPGAATSAVLRSLSATADDDLFAVELDARTFDEERKRFVGVRLGRLDLTSEVIERTETFPIDLRFATIGRINLHKARIKSDLDFSGAEIGSIDATDAVVDGDVSGTELDVDRGLTADDATVSGTLALNRARFGLVSLDGARIAGRLELNGAEIDSDLRGTELVVGGRFECKEGDIAGRINCPGLRLRGEKRFSNTSELTLRGTSVASHVNLEHVRSSGPLLLNDLDVGGDFRMDAVDLEADLWLGAVDDESTTLGSITVGGNLLVRNGVIGGDADLSESAGRTQAGPVVDGAIDLSETAVEGALTCSPNLTDAAFNVVRLRGATVESGVLEDPTNGDRILYDLRDATIGDLDLRAADGSVDSHHLVTTQFDGFVFGNNRKAFDGGDWRIHEVFDGGYRDLAVATAAIDAAELADDLLIAIASIDGFREALASEEPLNDALDLVARKYDTETIANGRENARDAALPERFERRESGRKGLVRALSAAYEDGTESQTAAVIDDPTVRELLLDAESNGYVSPDGGPVRTVDAGRAAIRSELHTAVASRVADRDAEVPDTETLLTTYLLAKNGANRVGDTNAASQFFRLEMRYRRRSHRESLWGRETVSGVARSAYDVTSNALFDLSSGYGERPRRVLVFSSAVVVVFTGLFAAMLDSSPYGGPAGYVLLSLESFVALILSGGSEQTDPLVRLTATVEGFIGAFLIALFVFTLTRSIDR